MFKAINGFSEYAEGVHESRELVYASMFPRYEWIRYRALHSDRTTYSFTPIYVNRARKRF